MSEVKPPVPVMMYSEQTPNPDSVKFVTNRMLYHGTIDCSDRAFAHEWAPLADNLYSSDFIKSVYINNNFVTVTRHEGHEWNEIMPQIKDAIKSYLDQNLPVTKEGVAEALAALRMAKSDAQGPDSPIVEKIRNLIDQNVKPAVEMDGGHIEFIRFEEGKVYVSMQGACSGCPSSSVTLKAGIEGLLKRMVPEVQEVVQEMM